jgi:hypothetical protein
LILERRLEDNWDSRLRARCCRATPAARAEFSCISAAISPCPLPLLIRIPLMAHCTKNTTSTMVSQRHSRIVEENITWRAHIVTWHCRSMPLVSLGLKLLHSASPKSVHGVSESETNALVLLFGFLMTQRERCFWPILVLQCRGYPSLARGFWWLEGAGGSLRSAEWQNLTPRDASDVITWPGEPRCAPQPSNILRSTYYQATPSGPLSVRNEKIRSRCFERLLNSYRHSLLTSFLPDDAPPERWTSGKRQWYRWLEAACLVHCSA